MNKGGFSWKRTAGITRVKIKTSRATEIPLEKIEQQGKMGKMVTGGSVHLCK